MKKLITTTAVVLAFAAVAAGCGGNSGNRSGKPVYGPGSTGNIGGGSTGGGVTPGGGGTGSGTGTFSSAPALGAPRAQHTATTLPDGRVLVTGGTDGNGTYQSSEVFDPVGNAWTPLQSQMTVNGFASARQLHTATLMSNGQVLIAGGLGVDTQGGQFGALASCVVFDPASDTFTATGAMPQARGWHSAANLPNGQVLVMAGVDGALATLRSSATFDPAGGQWTAAGNSGPHTWGALVTVGQQTIVAGGCGVTYNQGFQISSLASPVTERYDAQARTFGQAANNVGDRIYYAGAASSAGRALFAGGLGVSGQNLVPSDTTEVYDPAQNAFTPGPAMSIARFSPEIAEIANSGDMLIVGGIDGQANTAICEVFQMNSNLIIGQATMAEARVDHKAVTLNDGRILVVGGSDDQGNSLDTCEFYTR